MAKLVVLKQGSPGVTYELKAERTTVGRMEDNAFQIAEPSVSSHHCEILLKNNTIEVKDLGSTNGTYIQGEKITEGNVTNGQILRLGDIDVRFETGEPIPAASQSTAARKGVSLNELGSRDISVDQTTFTKKSNKADKMFIIGGVVAVVLIVGFLIYALFLSQGK